MRFNLKTVAPQAFTVLAIAAAVLTGCGGSTNTIVQTVVAGTPTPPVWSPQGTFQVSRTIAAAPSMPLPAGGGFAGTLALGATLLPYTQVTQEMQNVQPQISPLAIVRRPSDVVTGQILVYLGLLFDAKVDSSPLTLSMQVPPAALTGGAKYYLAFYDPLRPALGWQHGFAGPAKLTTSGATTSLAFNATAPTLDRYVQYWFAVYMISSSASPPTPAPSTSPMVTPSPLQQTLTDIQNTMSRAYTCSGTPCATGDIMPTQAPQDYDIYTNVQSPSLSGSSTQLTINPRPDEAGDVLYYTPSLGAFPLATNFVWDFWFTIDKPVWDAARNVPLDMQALEFDFNDDMPGQPGYGYNFSSQCFIQDYTPPRNGPQWQIWGVRTDGKIGWIDSGMPCHPERFTPMVWHHITWTYRTHPDTLQTEYVSLKIDADPAMTPAPLLNPVVELKKQANPVLEVQFQQDARGVASPSPFTEWVDNVTLTYW